MEAMRQAAERLRVDENAALLRATYLAALLAFEFDETMAEIERRAEWLRIRIERSPRAPRETPLAIAARSVTTDMLRLR